jgi:hypothetical protein
VMLSALVLTGCATIPGTVTISKPGRVNPDTERKARCAGWPVGTYSAKHDTAETVHFVRKYKAVGQRKGCW